MRHLHRYLITTCLLFSQSTFAASLFVEGLHWRATESIDWVFTLVESSSNEISSYRFIPFHFDNGLRAGINFATPIETSLFFTKFQTTGSDSVVGNLTSAFLGGKISGGTYTSGDVKLDIDYNMFDAQFSHTYHITPIFNMQPLAGIEGGFIKQRITNNLNGSASVTEKLTNDFTGIGPRIGIGGSLTGWESKDSKFNINALFSAAYLWGTWDLDDVLTYNAPSTGSDITIETGNHKFGSLSVQAVVGASYVYKNIAATLSYELNDWFDQGQIFDDATGGHMNDLILQGLNLKILVNLD